MLPRVRVRARGAARLDRLERRGERLGLRLCLDHGCLDRERLGLDHERLGLGHEGLGLERRGLERRGGVGAVGQVGSGKRGGEVAAEREGGGVVDHFGCVGGDSVVSVAAANGSAANTS
ncbi:MAG: hypothetical protein U0W40_15780 [Acidimicrobiia bacterium]